jgi:hypothetical protein
MKLERVVRFFIDTEFIEDGSTIDLISLAVVEEHESLAFYQCNSDAKLHLASDWVQQNVLPHLPPLGVPPWNGHAGIALDLIDYVSSYVEDGVAIEFWGYFSDYDWVAVCQLFGKMIDLPEGWPMFCMDLKQLMVLKGVQKSDLPQQDGAEHNALNDALWNRKVFQYLTTKPYVYL